MPNQDTFRLYVEQPPHDEAEAAALSQLAQLLATPDTLPADVRDLAPAVRQLFPETAYLVGCGSAHVWLHRAADTTRLALIR